MAQLKDQEKDQLRRTILESLSKGRVCWTDLKKKVLGSCQPFATDRTFSHQMNYLERAGYIKKLGNKGSRFPYEITEKGKQLRTLFVR
jgi:DNA-binding HxlR family transcriptional regulator